MNKTTYSCKTCGHKARITTANPSQEVRLFCVACNKKRIFSMVKEKSETSGLSDISSKYRMVSRVTHTTEHIELIENTLLTDNKPLYKYTKTKYANKVINDGVFRVGTLHEFQNIEKHGSEIGDHEEGIKYIRNAPGEVYDYSVPGSVPDFVKNFIRADEGQHVRIIGIPMVQEIISQNYYLYSVTSEIDIRSMKEFGYDAVVEIYNPVEFFHALTECLKSQHEITGEIAISPCDYRIRANHYSSSDRTHPAIIKDHSYQYQKEVRAIWHPKNKDINPLIIQCLDARKCCRLFEI